MEDYKKKYEDAVKELKKFFINNDDRILYKHDIERVFPELKENEDERIRKEIIQFLQLPHPQFVAKRNHEEWISWLEKQSEQKPQGKLALEVWKDMRLEVYQQASGNRHEPNYSDDSTKMFSLTDIDEIFEKVAEKQGEQKPAWSEEDEKTWSTISDLLWEGFKLSDGKVSWDKIRCWLLPKITYFKDRVQTHPKQEWSEEDEKLYTWCASAIQTRYNDGLFTMDEYRETSLWLKSLKERYTWKPSEEQMKTLNYIINLMASSESPTENDYYYNVLKDMRTHLKKLREE